MTQREIILMMIIPTAICVGRLIGFSDERERQETACTSICEKYSIIYSKSLERTVDCIRKCEEKKLYSQKDCDDGERSGEVNNEISENARTPMSKSAFRQSLEYLQQQKILYQASGQVNTGYFSLYSGSFRWYGGQEKPQGSGEAIQATGG